MQLCSVVVVVVVVVLGWLIFRVAGNCRRRRCCHSLEDFDALGWVVQLSSATDGHDGHQATINRVRLCFNHSLFFFFLVVVSSFASGLFVWHTIVRCCWWW